MLPVSKTTWLVLGALAGYALMMRTNPVRECLRDGWLAVRRYPAMGVVLGLLGFAHTLCALGTIDSQRPFGFTFGRNSLCDETTVFGAPLKSHWWYPGIGPPIKSEK